MSCRYRSGQNVVIDNNLCQGKVYKSLLMSCPRRGMESEHAMDVRLKRRRAGPHRAVEGGSSAGLEPVTLDQPERLKLGALEGHLGYFLRRLQVSVFKDFMRTLAPMDVRPAQYSVLLLV